jgi:hypothetical protein
MRGFLLFDSNLNLLIQKVEFQGCFNPHPILQLDENKLFTMMYRP